MKVAPVPWDVPSRPRPCQSKPANIEPRTGAEADFHTSKNFLPQEGMGGRVFIRNTVTTRENIGDFCDFIRNICRNKRNSIRNTLWGIFEF